MKIQNILCDYSNRKILRLVCNKRDKLQSQSNSEKCDKKLINCSGWEIGNFKSRCLASLDNFYTDVHLQINTSTTINDNLNIKTEIGEISLILKLSQTDGSV